MPLPDPGTRSPGKLVIYYQSAGIEHQASAWFKDPNDFSAVATIRAEAILFAEALMDMTTTAGFAHDWAILDPTGVTLYTEPFAAAIPGVQTIGAGEVLAHSVSLSSIGKGVPPAIGTAFGNTRTFVYPGYADFANWNGPVMTPATGGYVAALRDFLDGSTIVGADFFGQGAEYGVNYNIQVNAHHQKEFGV